MAFEPVNASGMDIKKEPGIPHVGTYTGKSDIVTKIGPQVVWNFLGEDDTTFGIYGFTNLNRAMSTVGIGALCRITYKGTNNVQTRFGMKDVHQVLVEVDNGAGPEPEPEATVVEDAA